MVFFPIEKLLLFLHTAFLDFEIILDKKLVFNRRKKIKQKVQYIKWKIQISSFYLKSQEMK